MRATKGMADFVRCRMSDGMVVRKIQKLSIGAVLRLLCSTLRATDILQYANWLENRVLSAGLYESFWPLC
jgi:hypothetical protein